MAQGFAILKRQLTLESKLTVSCDVAGPQAETSPILVAQPSTLLSPCCQHRNPSTDSTGYSLVRYDPVQQTGSKGSAVHDVAFLVPCDYAIAVSRDH